MIHLDTNILIDIVTVHSPQVSLVRQWLLEGKTLTASAVAWSEFLNGPHSHSQKDAVRSVLAGGSAPSMKIRRSWHPGCFMLQVVGAVRMQTA
jgi:predicted nucleic acid-binding protein